MTDIIFLDRFMPTTGSQGKGFRRGERDGATLPRRGVISIGNFDGVHRGHAQLLYEVRRVADRLGGPAVAVVLDPHPATLLRPQQAPPRLSWIERRAERMQQCGIDALVVCPTTLDFLKLTAEAFFHLLVVDRLAAQAIVEGPNFFFGRDRMGDIHTLAELCESEQIESHVVQPSAIDGEMISSTRIRGLLAAGEIEQASELLGAPHRIRGVVAAGAMRGRTIGFPTANLTEIDVMLPSVGVYGGYAVVDGQSYRAAIHLGPNPTFDSDDQIKTEVHLLDFEGDLYGMPLLVDFIHKVRDIARFDSADQLAAQLRHDIAEIRERVPPR